MRGRRRPRRLAAAAAVVAVVLAAAALVVTNRGPALDARSGAAAGGSGPASGSATAGPAGSASSTRLPVADDLLDAGQVARLGGPRRWTVLRTDANTSGDGLNSVCQQQRFADPRGLAALVRVFRAPGAVRRSAVQSVEVSRSPAAAQRAYRTTLGWYAECRLARLRLVEAFAVEQVGNQAQVLTLRVEGRRATTIRVAVARTGALVTATVSGSVGVRPPHVGQVVGALGDAVRNLCGSRAAGRCVARPTYRPLAAPPPAPGEEPGLLSAADLPPVGRVDRPWVATAATRTRRPAGSPSVTPCARADFLAAGATRSRTRTYLIPGAGLADRFGLSETYGSFRSRRVADRFVSGVRAGLRGCERRALSTRVGPERRTARGSPPVRTFSWLLTVTVAAGEMVPVRVAVVRVGRHVAQLTFTPAPGADLSPSDFAGVLDRAGDRLRELA